MPTSVARWLLATIIVVALANCASSHQRIKAREPISSITDGYSCFREQIGPLGAVAHSFYCVFALEQASSYYSAPARAEKVLAFIASLGQACRIGKTWDMEDPRRTHDHDLGVIVTAIRCD